MERVYIGGRWTYRVVAAGRTIAAGLTFMAAASAVQLLRRIPKLVSHVSLILDDDGNVHALRVKY
jgi:predicted choloylglycine hydrolase